MTQHQLAAASGVPRITISRIERGTDLRVSTALRLAQALDVTIADIWTPDGQPSKALLAAELKTRRRG